jgi:hypothetical protein
MEEIAAPVRVAGFAPDAQAQSTTPFLEELLKDGFGEWFVRVESGQWWERQTRQRFSWTASMVQTPPTLYRFSIAEMDQPEWANRASILVRVFGSPR